MREEYKPSLYYKVNDKQYEEMGNDYFRIPR